MSAEESDKNKPKTQAEGGGQGRPPRPTRVGSGGAGDDLGRFKRNFDINPEDLISWPLPELTFCCVRAVSGKLPAKKNEQLRMHSLAEVLSKVYAERANVAYVILSGNKRQRILVGSSTPNKLGRDNPDGPELIPAALRQTYEQTKIDDESISSIEVKDSIRPLTKYVGCMAGNPAFKCTASDATLSEQIDRILSGVQGHEFGLAIFAVPIPSGNVLKDESTVFDQIQRAREEAGADNQKQRRIERYLELQNAFLNQIRRGNEIGMWQVGGYYFAPERHVFIRLQSLLRASYADSTSLPITFRAEEMQGLQPHLLQLALLRNQRLSERFGSSLLAYRFLTPLNSQDLSAYIQVPAGAPI